MIDTFLFFFFLFFFFPPPLLYWMEEIIVSNFNKVWGGEEKKKKDCQEFAVGRFTKWAKAHAELLSLPYEGGKETDRSSLRAAKTPKPAPAPPAPLGGEKAFVGSGLCTYGALLDRGEHCCEQSAR